MPAADKCHLNIPFKEWAKGLRDALAGVDGVDLGALDRLGGEDFENHKAIERRVNDPGCGAGGCGGAYARYEGFANNLVLSGAATTNQDVQWDTLEEHQGDWSLSGGVIVPPDTDAIYLVNILLSFTESSGTDPVWLHGQILDPHTTWGPAVSTYTPPMGDSGTVGMTLSRLIAFEATGHADFSVSVIMDAAAPVTRSIGVYAEIYVSEVCGAALDRTWLGI